MTMDPDSTNELAAHALELVHRELNATLEAARHELEEYVDGREGADALRRAAGMLHLASGALKIVEVRGAALLADEMEHVCAYLANEDVDDTREKGIEALTRAMVQLPAYLDRLLSGGRDIALVLLPLLNDLRSVRGKPLMSEGTLLLLKTGPLEQSRRAASGDASGGQPRGDFNLLARKQRPAFQAALLGWIRGDKSERKLDELILVSSTLERGAGAQLVQQFWRVLTAVFVALRANGLEASVPLKRLIGQADRQLKKLGDGGEAAFLADVPTDLLNNLLYYVARANCTDERVTAVRQEFDLNKLVPGERQLEQVRESLSGPSVRLMRTVAEAIKQDLGAVKDSLDIFVRTGMQDYRQLLPQLEMLRKIGDTLGVLGLDSAQALIRAQKSSLDTMADGSEEIDPEVLERIATVLLNVEDELDKELVRAVVPGDDEDVEDDSEVQYGKVRQAVMGECIVNLAKIKEAVAKFVENPEDTRPLEQVNPLLRGIAAGLLMLNKTAAVRLIERVAALVSQGTGLAGGLQKGGHVERLADAIVSIEYYMETISAGRKDPWYMLENAARCLDVLERQLARGVAPTAEVPPETAAEQPSVEQEPAAAGPEAPAELLSVLETADERSDPELLEIFIQEAKDEIVKISENLPKWVENPDEHDALIATRRSFHTLKGSGRTVGATLIGQFAWSVENLMNRLINRTLEVSEPITELIEEAVRALPLLVDQLELGIDPRIDVGRLCRRADALAAGEVLAEEAGAEPLPEESHPAAAAESIDPVLEEIFLKETRGHLETIRDYLHGARQLSAPYAVDERLYRAAHTLLGSAKMANFKPCIAVVEPLSEYLTRCYQTGTKLPGSGLDMLVRAAGAIESVVDALESKLQYEEPAELIEEIRDLAASAPAEEALEPLPSDLDPGTGVFVRLGEQQTTDEEAADKPTEPGVGFDPEIAAIFTEEASELLDQGEVLVSALGTARNIGQPLGELQRLLHTLKGGARMAGIAEMGDLSHALETVLAGMAEGRLACDSEALALIQETLDQLQQMRESVDLGRPFDSSETLMRRLEQFAAGILDDEEWTHARIIEETANRPLDFDLTDVGIEPIDVEGESTIMLPLIDGDEERDISEFLEPEPDVVATFEFDDEDERGERGVELIGLEADVTDVGVPVTPDVETFEDIPAEETYLEDQIEGSSEIDALTISPERGPAEAPLRPIEPMRAADRVETARVDAQLLDALLNSSGEISIFQARLTQQLHSIDFHLGELGQTVTRLREQLRNLEAETEAEILYRHQDEAAPGADFDPLELDRYSTIQQLSRALAETANDVASINELLLGLATEAETLLTQQGRVTADVQDGLMQTRMVPFQRHVVRLARVVRQAAADTSKSAELVVDGSSIELDRQVLDGMLPAFEHLLRNSVVHGIESPETRRARGKPEVGRIHLDIRREGSEVSIAVADDGAGLNIDAIRRTAIERGLIAKDQLVTEKQAAELIVQPGFSTAGELTQAAGRGVGMDVVDAELKKLGGSMHIETAQGLGTKFILRLPYTLAITHALIVDVGEETFALPLTTVEGITRVRRDQLLDLLTQDEPRLEFGDLSYRLQHLGSLVGAAPSALPDDETAVPLVLIRAGEHSTALLTDKLEGSREVVVKSLGPHIASVAGVTGATILGDGRVIMILDPATLVRQRPPATVPATEAEAVERVSTALVVDDSITMRRVTQRLLERHGMKVLTARDGLDAVTVLQDNDPDVILLDIEMPRMDGYQFAAHVRNDEKHRHIPIIMITSRSGEKHRAKAIELGVNEYLSKPYQESQLIAAIEEQLGKAL